MDQQIRIGDLYIVKNSESSCLAENHLTLNGEEGNASDHELHCEVNSEFSDAATLEQRRAYKIELQVDIIWLRGREIVIWSSCKNIISYSHSIE